MDDIYSFLRKLQTQIVAPTSYVDPEAQGLLQSDSLGPAYQYGDLLKGTPYDTKFSGAMKQVEPGLYMANFQDPGKDKYSTLSAYYRIDPDTGMATMEGDPFQTRQTSKKETVKDFLEHGVPLVAAAAGAGYAMNPAYGGMASGTGATAGMEGFLSPELVGGSFGPGSAQLGTAEFMAGAYMSPELVGGSFDPASAQVLSPGYSAADMGVGAYPTGGTLSTSGTVTAPTIPPGANVGAGPNADPGLLNTLKSVGKEYAPWLRTAAGLYGAYEGSQEQPGPETAQQKQLDPRIDSRVFGQNGLLESADAQFQKNKATGQNETMVQAQDWLRGLLTSPEMQQGLRSQYNASQGLFNMAPNPFGRGWGG